MSPQQLLRETQRAAGDAKLTAWHDTLIDSGKELRDILEVCIVIIDSFSLWTYSSLSSLRVNVTK
jgi:hypothetical protein